MPTWPAETKSYALELRKQGEFYRKIASAIGKSQKAVEAYFMRLDRLGGKPPKPSLKGLNAFWTQDKRDRLVELLANGETRRTVAAEFGVSPSAISGIVDRIRQSGVVVKCNPPSYNSGPRKKTATSATWSRFVDIKAIQPPMRIESRSELTLEPGIGILLKDWGDNPCKWSIGYSAKGEHLFCAAPQHENTPYCADHHKRSIKERI